MLFGMHKYYASISRIDLLLTRLEHSIARLGEKIF
jgi:hypothetical protein